jgi:DNA-binding transcriptional MerR regulator
LNEQMSNLSASISEAGFSEEQVDEILRRTRESNERATMRAQEKMRRAQEKLERKLEAARRRSELKAQAAERRSQSRGKSSWNFEWTAPASQPARESVSDEERLMILRMLEQKKISLEEAEELLAALEGKET